MLLRLWLLTWVDCCCGGSGCCGSLTEELFLADWSSCFKLAMSFLAFSPASLWLHTLFEPGWPALWHHSLLLGTLSSFPPTAVQGVLFPFPDFGRLVQVFRGLSVSCRTASGVLCCYARIGLLGSMVSLPLVWSWLAVDYFTFALMVVTTSGFANKSAMKPGVAAGTRSTCQVSLRHYDLYEKRLWTFSVRNNLRLWMFSVLYQQPDQNCINWQVVNVDWSTD